MDIDEVAATILRYHIEWTVNLETDEFEEGVLVVEVDRSGMITTPNAVDLHYVQMIKEIFKIYLKVEGSRGLIKKVRIVPKSWEDNTGLFEVNGFGMF